MRNPPRILSDFVIIAPIAALLCELAAIIIPIQMDSCVRWTPSTIAQAILFIGAWSWPIILLNLLLVFLLALGTHNAVSWIRRRSRLNALIALPALLVAALAIGRELRYHEGFLPRLWDHIENYVEARRFAQYNKEFRSAASVHYAFAAADSFYHRPNNPCIPFTSSVALLAAIRNPQNLTSLDPLLAACEPVLFLSFAEPHSVEPYGQSRILYDRVIIWSGSLHRASPCQRDGSFSTIAVYSLHRHIVRIVGGWSEDNVYPTLQSNMREYWCQFEPSIIQGFNPSIHC